MAPDTLIKFLFYSILFYVEVLHCNANGKANCKKGYYVLHSACRITVNKNAVFHKTWGGEVALVQGEVLTFKFWSIVYSRI